MAIFIVYLLFQIFLNCSFRLLLLSIGLTASRSIVVFCVSLLSKITSQVVLWEPDIFVRSIKIVTFYQEKVLPWNQKAAITGINYSGTSSDKSLELDMNLVAPILPPPPPPTPPPPIQCKSWRCKYYPVDILYFIVILYQCLSSKSEIQMTKMLDKTTNVYVS